MFIGGPHNGDDGNGAFPRAARATGARKVVLSVVVGEDELAEIARAGYAEAASTDRKGREAAVSLFLSDAVWGLMH
jgi:hypothetical protein